MKASHFIIGLLLIVAAWDFGLLGGVVGGSAPFPADKLSVLIVEETSDRDDYPPSQVSAIESTLWKAYVKERGGVHRDLEPGADLSKEEPWVAAAMAVERESLPWLVVSDGSDGFSGPLPMDAPALLAKIKETGDE